MKRKSQNGRMLRWIARVTGAAKWYVFVLIVIQSALGACGVLSAMLLRRLVNAAVDGSGSGFYLAAIYFAVLTVFMIILRAANRLFDELSRSIMENRFKDRLFSVLLRKDYASVTQINSAEWINRLTSDTAIVADGVTQILPGVFGMAVKMVGALAAIIFLEPAFMYLLIPGGLLLIVFTYGFRKILKLLHKNIQEADGRLRVFLQERLGSLMIVRTFAQEKNTEKHAKKLMNDHKAAKMKRNHFSNICNIGFGAAINGVYVLGAIFCGYGILTGSMSYGNLLAVLQLIGQVQSPFANITGYLPKYYAMIASAERLTEAERFDDDFSSKDISESRKFYSDEFRGLGLYDASFTYRPPVADSDEDTGSLVFEGVDIEIKKGEYVAFTGPSGCGKSTVLKLFMCLYPIDKGERYILTDGGRIELTSEWRSLFAYVPQGNQLLSGTIREVIAFGDKKLMAEDERLHQALRIACAEEFVEKLDKGIDTQLGERGAGLSEGQMQRIAIARAIFSGHPILLLDEATSSLDEEVEGRLLENLRSMTDKTVIVVTHRMAALSICDRKIDFGEIRRLNNGR